ncbi:MULTISPECIES: metallophosphoesterase [unclassified Variovorax]|uniref:metallophosphoesterase n=1 Tax=unclassified Variovorax TaxID=663243 RepID=UPI0008B1D8DE|nr:MULTISPECIES: metallophosphoesterase [unclassified Variovorax]SEJ93942.1 Calcineurin-like phosphoesterase [Variovorax sp. OK202]SFD16864.1 Calcineurin-like phosphoesterase [Variovorax sp. OK212]
MANEPSSGASVCDCSDPAQQVAVILYPSLGTPLLIASGQKRCSLFIATSALGVANSRGRRFTQDKRAELVSMDGDEEQTAAATVARHLRLVGMTGTKPETDIRVGALTGDGADCAKARSAIKVWRVARFEAGALIYNQKGEVFATLSPQAVGAYTASGFTGGHVYEVDLDIDKLAVQPATDSFRSFAWMVEPTPQQKQNLPTLCAVGTVHSQDLLVESFLAAQVDDPRHRHQPANTGSAPRGKETSLVEYDVAQTAQKAHTLALDASQRLAAWHPVIRLSGNAPLKLAHLSDVHINVRHNALAKSPARVIEDSGSFEGPAVGARVCNSFNALKALFDKIGAGRKPDTALLFTGDLIDFNRNIDPRLVGDAIGEQWKKFNVLNHFNTPGLYPRGQDDMLAFSLVRYAYNELKLPVFMTSGNHEAYAVPYGISPRINDWGAAMGVLEDTTDTLDPDGWGRERAFRPTVTVHTRGGPHPSSRIGPMAEIGRRVVNSNKNLHIEDLAQTYKNFDSASQWHNNKANEGISADHNMSIYEATLAYGPTYAQALTGNNYRTENYDWFHTLFTPLEDVLIALGVEPDRPGPATQVIAALGWGQGENFKNLTVSGVAVTTTDRQGTGILPRATQSFSTRQLQLLGQAQNHKRASPGASLTVATHFTIINYDEPLPYSTAPAQARFVPSSSPLGAPLRGQPGFNQVNTGTCEINQDAYFERFVNVEGGNAGSATPETAVDWHFSGHSHRSGVYSVAWCQPSSGARMIQVTNAVDPGIRSETVKAPARQRTRFIVSSSGGPVGKQNLDNELDGWTLRPPSGTLLDPATGVITQVMTQRSRRSAGAPLNEKPRLAVALDYMAVMSRHPDKGIETPLAFTPTQLIQAGWTVPLALSTTVARLSCIAGVRFWVFEGGMDEEKRVVKQWHVLTTAFDADPKAPSVTFKPEDHAVLIRALGDGAVTVQAFCEVLLKQPQVGKDDWSKDMDCTDPWMFPLEIGVFGTVLKGGGMDYRATGTSKWFFRRPAEERGEVPDWKFLAKYYANKGYTPVDEAIDPAKAKEAKQ